VLRARSAGGRAVRRRASGFLARVFQHELDHLRGILFVDRVRDRAQIRWYSDEEIAARAHRRPSASG